MAPSLQIVISQMSLSSLGVCAGKPPSQQASFTDQLLCIQCL